MNPRALIQSCVRRVQAIVIFTAVGFLPSAQILGGVGACQTFEPGRLNEIEHE